MIRLIDLGKQTSDGEGPRQFAFWNTVSDMFLDYNGSQAWSTREQLQYDLFWHLGEDQAEITSRRLSSLLPNWADDGVLSAEFCLFCGAGIGKFRRDGEGTCEKCDKQ